ncbi:MAG: aa3-type cytochrome c oxidase subunit IV [Parasphingopyxis sp.]
MTQDDGHPDMDYKSHNNTYSGFLSLLKWGMILSGIATIAAIIAIT